VVGSNHFQEEDRMKKSKGVLLILATLLAYSVAFGQSGDFQTKGKVMTSGGQALNMATITYTNIAKRLSWDFSKSDGTFGGWGTQVIRPSQQNSQITLLGACPVTIDIFDLDGKKVGSVQNARLDKGTYSLEPVTSRLSKSVYMLKIKAGSQVIFSKLVNTGTKTNSSISYQLTSSDIPLVMAKKLADVDTVRIGKTGYTPVFKPIAAYTDDIGTVTLTAIDIEGQVNTIFGQMSSTEKCGQMCMPPSLGGVTSGPVGNSFGGGGALSGLTASSCANSIDNAQRSMATTARKVPLLVAYDFVHGASALPGAVIFPHNMGMGAIQDTLLIQKAFRVTAMEVRGCGCNWGFGPCIAVIRDDRWGRSYEGFCETPERTQIMARHAVLGIQTTDLSLPSAYAACAKHFAGDGGTASGTDRGQTTGPDATARTIHLPGYTSAVAAGVATIMPSFSAWCDGIRMHEHSALMTGWLKGTTGFNGFLVGDYDAAPIPGGIDAGVDVPMNSGGSILGNITGIYSAHQARFDDACKRVLRVKAWMGMLNLSSAYVTDSRLTQQVGSAAHRDVARACVRASMVLLKNANNVLPIPKTSAVDLWGTAGDNIGLQCGGWTVSWQGSSGTPTSGGTTIRAGMQALGGTVNFNANPSGAGSSSYVVAVWSEEPYAETTLPSISLTGSGKATASNGAVTSAVAAAHAAGKKVIGILIAGRPMDITAVIANCDAFIWASLPGTEGRGVGEMLYADQGYKFTGKLPVTWPNSVNDEPINQGDGKTGLFAYGFGLTD
jgi:beta-glucosidase